MPDESSRFAVPMAAPWSRLITPFQRLIAWLGASRLRFAFVCAATLVLAYNVPLWRGSIAAVGGPSVRGLAFLVALAAMVIAIHAFLLLLIPGRRIPAVLAAALLISASIVLYYEVAFNVYFDKVMVRNVFETDPAEVRDLLTPKLIAYVLLLGVVPACIVAQVRLPSDSWRRRLGVLAAALIGTIVLVGGLSLAFSSHLASYLREHKPLRYLVNPLNFIYGAVAYTIGEHKATRPFEYREGNIERIAAARGSKPLLVLVVLGETARAANFQLGGYARPTNPQLSQINDLIYFGDVSSCGTSTATSLPCMFSHLGRKAFDVDLAPSQSNLLDAVTRGEVDVEWRDNNSGCKHICARTKEIDFRSPPYNEGCTGEECFDEVMTKGLVERLQTNAKDALVVFHQAGSHGPAYFERYPPAFARFKPDCRTKELAQCQRDAIVNAYDNTILYTDYVVAKQIELLESLQDRYDSLLLYVSDHGESLGENGVYLHAAPYFMAPREQTHVPMILWMSQGYRARSRTDEACVRARAEQPASHDDLYHTVLGALGLRGDAYDPALDLLAGCRKTW